MTDIATQRETDRRSNGEFGEHTRSEPENVLPPAIERHAQEKAAGAIATAYDNGYIEDFEREHPEPDLEDIGVAIFDIPGWDPDSGDESSDDAVDRRNAVAELSRRLAAGQSGTLRPASELRSGDRVDFARLLGPGVGSTEEAAWYESNLGVVSGFTATGAGSTFISVRDRETVVLPEGALVPVIGHTFHGEDFTELELVQHLQKRGDLAPAASGIPAHEAIEQFIEANALNGEDDDFPHAF